MSGLVACRKQKCYYSRIRRILQTSLKLHFARVKAVQKGPTVHFSLCMLNEPSVLYGMDNYGGPDVTHKKSH